MIPSDAEDESEDDSLFVRFVETCNAPLARAGRVERQEVRSDVEICGLGVMIDVCIMVLVAGTFELVNQSSTVVC